MLNRTDLRELGGNAPALTRFFRKLDVVFLPGMRRGYVRAEDYLALIEKWDIPGRSRAADVTFGALVGHGGHKRPPCRGDPQRQEPCGSAAEMPPAGFEPALPP